MITRLVVGHQSKAVETELRRWTKGEGTIAQTAI